MDLNDLQRVQRLFDEHNWHHQPGFDSIRHVTLHMGKLLGKLATHCEAVEHGEQPDTRIIDEEVIPDLIHNALRLANQLGIADVDLRVRQRWDQIAARNLPLDIHSHDEHEGARGLVTHAHIGGQESHVHNWDQAVEVPAMPDAPWGGR